jgi:hypothetical protein
MDRRYELKSFIVGLLGGGILGNLLPDLLKQRDIFMRGDDDDKLALMQTWLVVLGVSFLCIWIIARELS